MNVLWREFVASLAEFVLLHLAALAVFLDHVFRVVGQRAEEKMIGIYAMRDVAPVKNTLPDRDRAMVQFPRDAVSLHESSAAVVFVAEQDAVPSLIDATACRCPQPARFCFLNLLPKAIGYRPDARGVGAAVRAETAAAVQIGLFTAKTLAALWTPRADDWHGVSITACSYVGNGTVAVPELAP